MDKWKKLRSKISPTFTPLKMKFIHSTIVEVAERLRDYLLKSNEQQFEMKDVLARFTTDVIGTSVFGIECNSLNDPDAEFRHYGRRLFEEPRYGVLVRRILDEYDNIGRKFCYKKIPDDISAFFMRAVRDNIAYREENNVHRNDFMDLLIKLKNENVITFNELAAQAFVFFQAGFESSASTLTFCLYELALNLDIQNEARRIIRETYEKYNGQFTYEMMNDMPYIDQILEGKHFSQYYGSFLIFTIQLQFIFSILFQIYN